MSSNPVIVFEGIEGSGKTYHINAVAKYLKRKRVKFIKIREPGGSPNSEKIRKLILNKNSNFNRNTDLLLYLAARSENIEKLKKFYKKKVILIDRFSDSTIAYQHYGFGINLGFIEKINNHLLKNFKVNFTFLNVVNEKNMRKRLNLRKKLNRYDSFDRKFYTNVQNGFLKIAKRNKKKYQIIDSNLEIKHNKSLIIKTINNIIK
tara:strand:+ start:237 stop:851 length:615 start_codon:yes stop_codon:yes gene_type:complete